MKKQIAVALCAVTCAAAILSGCGAQSSEPSGSTPTENVVVSTVSLPGEVAESSAITISTVRQKIQKGNVTIVYEQVSEGSSSAMINQLLTKDTSLFLKNGLPKEKELSGEMKATVMQHGETLCIVTTGNLTNKEIRN